MPTPGQAPLGSLLDEAPIAMLGVDQAGVILFVNRLTEQLFGYDRDELVGELVESLMPESFRTAHTRQRAGHFAHPVSRTMGTSRELTARRRDGTEFPAEISLSSAIETEDGIMVTAAIRDTTERNRSDQDLQRLAAIVRDSGDAIIGKTLDGIITSWNPAAERMSGYSSEEIVGKTIELIADEQRSAEMRAILDKVRNGERTENYDTIRIHKDGTAFPVVLTVSPIRDADGVIIGSSTISRDVTKQMQAFDAARGMIESSLDALVAISPEGMITDANEATIKITGVAREDLIGTAFSDYFTEPDKADEIYQRVFADGMAVDYALVMRHRNGTLTDVLYNASVYRDLKGNVLGVFAAARDVTVQMNDQREMARHQAREMDRLAELERFQRLTVGRELKMIELKKEVESLKRLADAGAGESDDWR